MQDHIDNKSLIREVYRRVFGQGDIDFANTIVADDYIQHNPMIKTGKVGIMEFLGYLKSMPRPANPVKPFMRFVAEGTYVVVHSSIAWQNQQNATVDIYRVYDGKLAEHWDAVQVQPPATANSNPMVEGPFEIEDIAQTNENKSLVSTFYQEIFIDKKMAKLADYVTSDLIQHIPDIENGITGLQQYIIQQSEIVILTKIHRVIGEGNFVVIQAEGTIKNAPHVFYDIFHLQKGKIIEQWGVRQAIPATMAHSNGML